MCCVAVSVRPHLYLLVRARARLLLSFVTNCLDFDNRIARLQRHSTARRERTSFRVAAVMNPDRGSLRLGTGLDSIIHNIA